jgi:hypothetical protein
MGEELNVTTQHLTKFSADIDQHSFVRRAKTAANSTYPKGGVSCFADSFVVAESSVLRINICGEKPAHRKSAKRYASP